MQSAIEQFRISISRIRSLIAVYSFVEAQTTSALDISDMLRAALVMTVSALDYYIHEVTKLGMLEIYRGQRPEVPAFSRFQVSLGSFHCSLNATPSDDSWLENEIQLRHGYKSFQQSEKIAEAIRLISEKKLWEEVSKCMGITPQTVKQKIDLIVDRRNKIAHEADVNPTYPGDLWPIDETSVKEAVDFIEQVVETIHKLL
jgi:hypothetical protein